MIVFNPTLKYLFACNIWLWQLEEKYCNQWTDSFPDASKESVLALIKNIVSDYTVEPELRDQIDSACFCGHYAAPPPSAHDTPASVKCLGMQFAPRKLSTNLSMTTHQYRIPGAKPRSTTAC